MINNVSDINGTEFTDEMVEDLWAEQLSDNQMLREELAQLDDLVTLNRILKAFDSYGKKQIIRAIQAIHSNLNQIYKQQARIMGIKVDPKDEYPDFIQVYSSIYLIRKMNTLTLFRYTHPSIRYCVAWIRSLHKHAIRMLLVDRRSTTLCSMTQCV
jgi:hypothetical protein